VAVAEAPLVLMLVLVAAALVRVLALL